MSKHKNIGVWADKKNWLQCGKDSILEKIYFDSQAEYAFAQSLKQKERAGLIAELKHHPRIKIIPAIYYNLYKDELQEKSKINWRLVKRDFRGCVEKLLIVAHKAITYEADFSYKDKNGLHYIEVKNAINKGPYIPNLVKFRHKVELLKKIHGIEVEIYTGNIKWKFNGKKLEVASEKIL